MEMNGTSSQDSTRAVPSDTDSSTAEPLPLTVLVDHAADARDMEGSLVTGAASNGELVAALAALTHQVNQFHERSVRSEEIIRTMQGRITDLQGDQIQALLKPIIQRFAGLHAQAAEAHQAAISRHENAAADFSFFMTSIEEALGLIDFDSVGAAVGGTFDSRQHHATSVAVTSDPALDKTIQRVIRQGFTHADSVRVSIPAQVTIYQYDESLLTTEPTPDRSTDVVPAPSNDPSITL